MKKKNKVLITSVVAIGIATGSYFAFAGGGSEVAMAYSGYKVTEKQIQNAQNLVAKLFQMELKLFHSIQQKEHMN